MKYLILILFLFTLNTTQAQSEKSIHGLDVIEMIKDLKKDGKVRINDGQIKPSEFFKTDHKYSYVTKTINILSGNMGFEYGKDFYKVYVSKGTKIDIYMFYEMDR